MNGSNRERAMPGQPSLVVFTLLAQGAVGLALAAQLWGVQGALARAAVLEALLLTGLGLGAAFRHLGAPARAWRAVANFRSSWLSRECAFLGGFFVLALAKAILEAAGQRDSAAAGWLMVAAGAAALVSMGSIYGRTAMPAWKALHIHLSFTAAAVSLGSLALAALGAWISPGAPLVPQALAVTAAAVAVQLMELGSYTSRLAADGTAAQDSLRLLSGWPQAAGAAFLALGGLAFPLLAGHGSRSWGPWPGLGLVFLATGQALLRHAFFTSGVHPMAAGWSHIPYHPRWPGTR
jgi:DMSO reductase anchor subunit